MRTITLVEFVLPTFIFLVYAFGNYLNKTRKKNRKLLHRSQTETDNEKKLATPKSFYKDWVTFFFHYSSFVIIFEPSKFVRAKKADDFLIELGAPRIFF